MEPNDLKFTTAGDYIKDQMQGLLYYINEAGLKIDRNTGELWKAPPTPCDSQIHAP